MTLKVIPLLQAFSSAIRRTFVQYFTRFQLTARRAVPQRQLGFLFISFLIAYNKFHAGYIRYQICKSAIHQVQLSSLAFRNTRLCCHSNEICATIANPPNVCTTRGIPYQVIISQSCTLVRTEVWECGDGMSDRQTYKRPWSQNISLGNAVCEMLQLKGLMINSLWSQKHCCHDAHDATEFTG